MALDHAHQSGIVHRDLKPSNILIDGRGEPHLVDFGLAKREKAEATITADGKILGTAAYMAPEQARGHSHQADRRADIYSLGIIFFELLTDRRPFQGSEMSLIYDAVHTAPPKPRKVNRKVPRTLERICLRCLEKKPADRYQSAEELALDLQKAIGQSPVIPDRVKRLKTERRNRQMKKLTTLGLYVLSLILVLALGFNSWKSRDSAHTPVPEESSLATKTKAEQSHAKTEAEQSHAEKKVEVLPTLQFARRSPPTPLAPKDVPRSGLPHAKGREYFASTACNRNCHTKPNAEIGVKEVGDLDDGWVLLNEMSQWEFNDRHSGAYSTLDTDAAKEIANNLPMADQHGNGLPIRDIRCLACHTGAPLDVLPLEEGTNLTVGGNMANDARLTLGVDCEGCHGASGNQGLLAKVRGWKDEHFQDGWRHLPAAEKRETFGLYDLTSPIHKTKLCLSCHQGNVQTGRILTPEMLKAGHPPLPKFEIESFLTDMPMHWRSLGKKPADVREAWLNKTGKEFDSQDHLRSKRVLIGSLIHLSEQLALVADLCDSSIPCPVPRPAWIEFAPLVLPGDEFERLKKSFEAEGIDRGTDSLWSTEMAEMACKYAGISREEFHERISRVIKAMKSGLSGELPPLIQTCRETSTWLESIALQLEERPFPAADAKHLLRGIADRGECRDVDYETARQFVWAFHVVRNELKHVASPEFLNENAYYTIFDLGEVNFNPDQKQASENPPPMEIYLSLMDEVLHLNLRVKLPMPSHQDKGSMRSKYHPDKIKERFGRILPLLDD